MTAAAWFMAFTIAGLLFVLPWWAGAALAGLLVLAYRIG